MDKTELQKRLKLISAKVIARGEYLRFYFSMYGYIPDELEDCNNLQVEFGKAKNKVNLSLNDPISTDSDWYYYVITSLKGLDECRDFVNTISEYNQSLTAGRR